MSLETFWGNKAKHFKLSHQVLLNACPHNTNRRKKALFVLNMLCFDSAALTTFSITHHKAGHFTGQVRAQVSQPDQDLIRSAWIRSGQLVFMPTGTIRTKNKTTKYKFKAHNSIGEHKPQSWLTSLPLAGHLIKIFMSAGIQLNLPDFQFPHMHPSKGCWDQTQSIQSQATVCSTVHHRDSSYSLTFWDSKIQLKADLSGRDRSFKTILGEKKLATCSQRWFV